MGNLNLMDEEKTEVEVMDVEEEMIVRHGKLSLIGLVESDKTINKDSLETTMLSLWKPNGWANSHEVGDN